MSWTVTLSRHAEKQKAKLPKQVQSALLFLAHEIARCGPVRGDWPNYGKLGEIRLVEITYVGTHEKAPY